MTSSRARERREAYALKQYREPVEAFQEPEDGPEEDDGPRYSCPYCGKTRNEPFHCTPCNYLAEGPGCED